MDIREFLRRLDHVSGPNASGEYMARCPCHDDRNASLSVTVKKSGKDGKERIYFFDQSRQCTNEQIMAFLGVTARDLIIDPDPAGSTGAKPAPPVVHKAKPVKPAGERKPEPKIDLAHPDTIYSYTDVDGKELFQVCRYSYTNEDGKPDKTFRQRTYDPQNPKANRSGYVASVPSEIRNNALYHLPQVAAAIRDGRPVYIVEGEKDADTLARLGYTATTNACGAEKWYEGHAAQHAGADAIILPDNDSAGCSHAMKVALSLVNTAKRIRLVDIREACPELPTKGDVSDMCKIMGDTEAMDALARQVAATREFDPAAVPFWLTPMEQAEQLYAQVPGYGVERGCIVQMLQNGTKALTDFVVIPRMELTRDDGVDQSMYFVLDGWNSAGHKLGRVTIGSKDLDAMSWVTSKWGFSASLAPGSANKDKVAWAVKKVGQLTAKRVTEYSHTGWRRIGGKWAYLYHGGAIGMDGVTVDLGPALKSYRLDGGGVQGFDEIDPREAAAKSLAIQTIMKEEIGIALLGTAYLAPLREFLAQTDIIPAFALFLHGESGTHKTTAAALALSHFGNFHAKNPPASFSDTMNSIRNKAFAAKDMLLLVDDFHPVSSLQEKRQMAAAAQNLSRTFGDGADRGRLNADRSVQAPKPPRSVAVITGEDLPAIGASGLARFFIVDVDKGDIPVGKELTDMQEDARKGCLQKAMRGYIAWLLDQADQLPAQLHDLFLQYRDMVHKMSAGQHDRAPEAVACIMIGYAMMLRYMISLGMFDREGAFAMLKSAAKTLTEASKKQAREMENDKPTRIFLTSMTELMASKAVILSDISGGMDPPLGKGPGPGQDLAGYMDQDYYYLLPNVAFGAVQKLCREQGVEFPVSLKALYKHLRTDGVLPGILSDGNPTRNKWIDGRAVRLLWIPRRVMDGPPASQEQLRMEWREVHADDVPEEWQ